MSWQTADIVDKLAEVIAQYDVILVDFAGRDDRAVAAVLSIADILISPAKPSHLDLDELDRFIRWRERRTCRTWWCSTRRRGR